MNSTSKLFRSVTKSRTRYVNEALEEAETVVSEIEEDPKSSGLLPSARVSDNLDKPVKVEESKISRLLRVLRK